MLATASSQDWHRAFALAAQHGHVEIVRLLFDASEDPNRYNPEGSHDHSTPLPQAVWSGHDAVVRLLVERGAGLDIRDTVYEGTPPLPVIDHDRDGRATTETKFSLRRL